MNFFFLQEYKSIVDTSTDHILVDVRLPVELEICQLPNCHSILVLHQMLFALFFWHELITMVTADVLRYSVCPKFDPFRLSQVGFCSFLRWVHFLTFLKLLISTSVFFETLKQDRRDRFIFNLAFDACVVPKMASSP